MLQASHIELRVGPRVLIESATFTVNPGDRIGLVGRNGAGKTTLLKTLAQETRPHAGEVLVKGRVGYLPQDPRTGDLTAIAFDRILSGRGMETIVADLDRYAKEMGSEHPEQQQRAMRAYAQTEEVFSAMGGYAARADAEAIAFSLGLEERVLGLPLENLSGGQRRRVELARILFSHSDILLLDEPTNHLDADSIVWLKGFLKSHSGGLIVISHDVELLDEVVNRVAYLDAGSAELAQYSMGYRAYLVARAQAEERARKERSRIESQVATLTTQANKMRGSTARRARTAKVLDRRADRLITQLGEARAAERRAKVKFPDPLPCGRTPITATMISKSYGSLEVFTGIDLAIDRGSKVAIIGLNGAGKTTMLRTLAGLETPDTGEVNYGPGVRLGYYAQEHETLDARSSVFANLRRQAPHDVTDTDLRSLLGSFMFSGDTIAQEAGTLSGGEKTRLALAALVAQRANVLLLDEPTNNLDPASREQVLDGLASYGGAVILVTHDPGAVRALAPERVLLLPDGAEDFWKDEYYELIELS
ncbi:MAG: ABC-F family ATP-binding cassette domain-containing protein [Acidimicrobiales bacterium]